MRPLVAEACGPGCGWARGYWTIWVSPQLGHMTSIGRLLVVISIADPQDLHVTLIGAGPGVAVEGGGGRGAAGRSPGAIGAMPPIVLRHSTSIRMKRKTTRRSRTTLIAGTPPTSAANGFNPPMCTTSIVDAPVYASRTWT